MRGKDAERILFEVISHRIRRAIIASIAEKGPRSFTELMNDAGVSDTGTMTFHLRKMDGFIRKNEKGLYEPTDLGRRAYGAIKLVERPREAQGTFAKESRTQQVAKEAGGDDNLVIISDSLDIYIDRSLLEKIKSKGKKLLVKDALE